MDITTPCRANNGVTCRHHKLAYYFLCLAKQVEVFLQSKIYRMDNSLSNITVSSYLQKKGILENVKNQAVFVISSSMMEKNIGKFLVH